MVTSAPVSSLYVVPSPTHDICDIDWNSQRNTLSIGKVIISFTPAEYRLLFPLRHGTPVTYGQLAHYAYNYVADDKVRIMMDKHIDRIRTKLRGSDFYVYCILGYGYMLLPALGSDEQNTYTNRRKK